MVVSLNSRLESSKEKISLRLTSSPDGSIAAVRNMEGSSAHVLFSGLGLWSQGSGSRFEG